MVDNLGRLVFTIPFNLRSEADTLSTSVYHTFRSTTLTLGQVLHSRRRMSKLGDTLLARDVPASRRCKCIISSSWHMFSVRREKHWILTSEKLIPIMGSWHQPGVLFSRVRAIGRHFTRRSCSRQKSIAPSSRYLGTVSMVGYVQCAIATNKRCSPWVRDP